MLRLASKWVGVLIITMVMTLGACAGGKDFSYYSDNEVPKGPGLFSGDDGYFTIYRKEGTPAGQQQAETEEASETKDDKTSE